MVIAAGQEGKWKTSLQLVGIICLCVHYTHPLTLPWASYPVDYNKVGKVLVYLSMAMSRSGAPSCTSAPSWRCSRSGAAGPETRRALDGYIAHRYIRRPLPATGR